MESEKLLNVLFNIFCIVGCVYQIQNIVISYFLYETVTQNEFSNPSIVTSPSLHYCFLCLDDGIEKSAVEKKYRITTPKDSGDMRNLFEDLITISDMLQFSSDTAIDECKFRDETGNIFIDVYESKQCKEYFNTKKYILQQYICYQIKLENRISVTFRSIESSLRTDRVIFEIRISSNFSSFRKVRLTVTDIDYPILGRVYSPSYYKVANSYMSIHVQCINFTTHNLGYPYSKYICESDFKHADCMKYCMTNETLSKFNRLPFTFFYDTPIDYSMVSFTQMRNRTISIQLNQLYEKCSKKCTMYPCHPDYCITSGYADSALQFGISKPGSTIRIETTGHPNANINSMPKVSLLDFIIYTLSSLGIWFGLVIVSCNPFKYITYSCIRILYARILMKFNIQALSPNESQPVYWIQERRIITHATRR